MHSETLYFFGSSRYYFKYLYSMQKCHSRATLLYCSTVAFVASSLLDASEQFMRLHSDCEIASMSRDDVLCILQLGAGYSMHQFADVPMEDLKVCLTRFERNRSIWIWHDHSSLGSHGVLAVMVGVVYDTLVFKTETEVGHSVQEYIEEGAIHMLAHCSSTLDEAVLIP